MSTEKTRPVSRTKIVALELEKLHEYGCQDVLLIDADGLIVGAAAHSYSAQNTAALAARVMAAASKAVGEAELGSTDEVAVRTEDGMKLVCRRLQMGPQQVTLVCTLPYTLSHRHVNNMAIRAIEEAWSPAGGSHNGSHR